MIKHTVRSGGVEGVTQYAGNIVYEGGRVSYILTEEGRLVADYTDPPRKFLYEYSVKDHLGNTRAVFMGSDLSGAVDIVQKASYYPFGLIMKRTDFGSASYPKNSYLYNGKELNSDKMPSEALNWYDYGARFYDPQIARWTTIDPLAESSRRWSPYNYTMNNPIRFIDPDGMSTGDYYDKDLNWIGTDGIDDKKKYLVTRDIDVDEISIFRHGKVDKNDMSIFIATIELPDNYVINKMGDAVSRAESPSTEAGDIKGGFHEEGGNYGKDRSNGSSKVIEAKPSKADPEVRTGLGINNWDAKNPSEWNSSYKPEGSFHVHPSGSNGNRAFGTEPSSADLETAKTISNPPYNITGVSYVLAPRVNKVFLYNYNGNIASVPLDRFLNLAK